MSHCVGGRNLPYVSVRVVPILASDIEDLLTKKPSWSRASQYDTIENA